MKEFKKISVTTEVHEILKKDKKHFNLKSLSEVILLYRNK